MRSTPIILAVFILGSPAVAQTCAMPAPMVPSPTTPTREISATARDPSCSRARVSTHSPTLGWGRLPATLVG